MSIELQGLSRRYGEHEAVKGLTLSIRRARSSASWAPMARASRRRSRCSRRCLKPTGGRAVVGGFDLVSQSNDVRRVIGYVPEGAELYDVLTGTEFLDFVGDLHRLSGDEAAGRRSALADRLEIAAELDRRIGEYSKGMKQKLLLIAALQHEPAVLLLDEPLDGLDVAAQEELKGILRERAAEGGAVVYSSHILEVVERVCDRVAILHRGELAALGAPRELAVNETLSQMFLRITGSGTP